MQGSGIIEQSPFLFIVPMMCYKRREVATEDNFSSLKKHTNKVTA